MGVVATNVLKEVWKEYSDEFKVQENFNNENTLVLQEQVKMELEMNQMKILQISGLMQLFQLAGKMVD